MPGFSCFAAAIANILWLSIHSFVHLPAVGWLVGRRYNAGERPLMNDTLDDSWMV